MSKIKKIAALITAAMMTFGTVSAVFATADNNAASENVATDGVSNGSDTSADGNTHMEGDDVIYMEDTNLKAPNTEYAEAALLMDFNSGRLIYGKNIDEKLYPASTTKMMTAIIALESGMMGDTATATYEALQSITLEDSHMGILIGEELSMTDLVNGMLVYSANDAANVIACHIGGTMANFVDMMNTKAQELGMVNTHFMNPCGVHDDNHYTTAQDLAILARYCMANETFREIVKQPLYHIEPTNKYAMARDLPSTNLFLSTARSTHYLYKPCTGIKTGTTEAAGHCLVASAGYNDMNLLTVVLKCQDEDYATKAYSYITTRSLFDFGFNNYKAGTLATPGSLVADSKVAEAKNGKRVSLTVDSDVNALVPVEDSDVASKVQPVVQTNGELKAPIHKGDVLGTVTFNYRGTSIGTANLVAANDVEQNKIIHFANVAMGVIINPIFFIPAIIILIIAMIASAKARRVKRKRRLAQIRQRRASELNSAYDRQTRNTELNRTRSKGDNSRYSNDSPRRR